MNSTKEQRQFEIFREMVAARVWRDDRRLTAEELREIKANAALAADVYAAPEAGEPAKT